MEPTPAVEPPPAEGPLPRRPVRVLAPVVRNRKVADETWWTELEAPEIARGSVPGQFLMIGFGVGNTDAPFIPRPFSVGWCADDGRVGLLVRAFGPGTRRLGALRSGDRALLLGPLGVPFRLQGERAGGGARRQASDRRILCVAGGVGLAPFIFLADRARRDGRDVTLVYGERTADRVFDTRLLESLTGGPVEVWTEDGSRGRKGLVTAGVDLSDDPLLLGCGPDPLLRALAELAREEGADLQVSVEEHMGCGVGTCQGCVVRGADGRWIKSCVEGPVFDTGDLDWEWRLHG